MYFLFFLFVYRTAKEIHDKESEIRSMFKMTEGLNVRQYLEPVTERLQVLSLQRRHITQLIARDRHVLWVEELVGRTGR